jgi:hypothetical protein
MSKSESKSDIPGLTIYGVTALFGDGTDNSPVYLFAEMVDDLIANGTFQAGTFNDVNVRPPVSDWPERWRFLKGN